MTGRVWFAAWMLAVLAAAAALRLARLDNRTMHCDEANHAIKFGRLLERDDYVYDPREYHGPSLNFLTLPIARLAGLHRLTEIRETHLRLLPAVFGVILVGLVWAVREEMGCVAAGTAATLAAVSSAMVFYSRYYIQEMLLACFTFGAVAALWRYAREAAADLQGEAAARRGTRLRQTAWLLLLGLCLGMMHASKETCVIPLLAGALAAPAIGGLRRLGGKRLLAASLIAASAAAAVSALFFSSFGRNPRGVLDSATTYFYYFGRASGEGVAGRHVHPWDYYLWILFWHRDGGFVWSELSIAAFALTGLVAAALGKGLPPAQLPVARFLGIYTVVMTVVYSCLPYKTPWCALGLLHGMILLGGLGAAVLVRAAPTLAWKAAAVGLLAAAVGHLAWQSWRASFRDFEDPGNPYVYAHATSDARLLAQRVVEIAAVHPDGAAMHVQAICADHDYWPLPWYLRGLRRVGWHERVDEGPAAPLIITQPSMEGALAKKLYEALPPGERRLYVPLPHEPPERDWLLRPQAPLRAFVRLDLWEAYQARPTQ